MLLRVERWAESEEKGDQYPKCDDEKQKTNDSGDEVYLYTAGSLRRQVIAEMLVNPATLIGRNSGWTGPLSEKPEDTDWLDIDHEAGVGNCFLCIGQFQGC